MAKIKIKWLKDDGTVLGETLTNDEYNEEEIKSLTEYLNDTTEGLHAPYGWQQFELVPSK